ncbi:MOSC domain-containing protein [Halomonas sp. HP20-15]|uniref:MOSC domain-containing protein n=1 Tax=Halomonas sp. HP20-15 TaxID=3085901 RepID=UPI0029823A08|nr:MOSC domain-containing protein [Halomonas sp. HP20-15]MDW5377875.1 MOSC domain-containing protein [Halomonas sp. HP20-15]
MLSGTAQPRLAGLYRYPVKSTAGQALERARVTEEGLVGDRRYMLAKPDGTFITARSHPRLQRVVALPFEGGLALSAPGLGALEAREADFSAASFATGVWGDDFAALTTTERLDDWFGAVLDEPVRLLWLGRRSPRYRSAIARRVSFADGYPLMLISQASLDDLNTRMATEQRMAQFRPNLVVEGTEPYAEDGWKRIRIGELEFAVDKPCSRCKMITVDPASGEFMPRGEPLRTLAGYRRGAQGKIYFGQNLIALNEGELTLDAPLEVLETQPVTR